MKIFVGLGNPGEQYTNTRHNLGFAVLDEYVRKHLGPAIDWSIENKFKAEILKLSSDLWLVKPQTFMNNSGQAVKSLAAYYKLPPTDIIVIHDDLDLILGKMKIRLGGSGGGHHGVESVIGALKTEQFARVRLGIAPLQGSGPAVLAEHKKDHFEPEHFVLEAFMPGERPKVKQIIKRAVMALDLLLDKGLEVAQNQYN